MAETVQLMSAGFNKWMEAAELRLTEVKDGLSLLESQERRLSGIWEGGAEQRWDAEFHRELSEIRHFIAVMEGLLQKTEESAEALFSVEKGLTEEAERL